MSNPLATAQANIRELVMRESHPMSSLEAVFQVTEGMSEADARDAFQRLLAQRYLCQLDGDIAQMLAAKLGVAVQWSHLPLVPDGEWVEGRGANVSNDTR